MDGVAVVHDEFRGRGLSGVREFMDEGAVFDERGLSAAGYVEIFDAQGQGNDFKQENQFTYW